MITDIVAGNPTVLTFAPVIKAVEQTTNSFLNIIFTGRIMGVPLQQLLDVGVQDLSISGQITGLTQVRRQATANEEG